MYESLESSETDLATSTLIFELDKALKGTEMTFIKDGDGSGTYSSVSPNDTNSPTGQGTWLANASDPVKNITLDQGTTDEQYFNVLILTATQLHLASEDNSVILTMKFRAK